MLNNNHSSNIAFNKIENEEDSVVSRPVTNQYTQPVRAFSVPESIRTAVINSRILYDPKARASATDNTPRKSRYDEDNDDTKGRAKTSNTRSTNSSAPKYDDRNEHRVGGRSQEDSNNDPRSKRYDDERRGRGNGGNLRGRSRSRNNDRGRGRGDSDQDRFDRRDTTNFRRADHYGRRNSRDGEISNKRGNNGTRDDSRERRRFNDRDDREKSFTDDTHRADNSRERDSSRANGGNRSPKRYNRDDRRDNSRARNTDRDRGGRVSNFDQVDSRDKEHTRNGNSNNNQRGRESVAKELFPLNGQATQPNMSFNSKYRVHFVLAECFRGTPVEAAFTVLHNVSKSRKAFMSCFGPYIQRFYTANQKKLTKHEAKTVYKSMCNGRILTVQPTSQPRCVGYFQRLTNTIYINQTIVFRELEGNHDNVLQWATWTVYSLIVAAHELTHGFTETINLCSGTVKATEDAATRWETPLGVGLFDNPRRPSDAGSGLEEILLGGVAQHSRGYLAIAHIKNRKVDYSIDENQVVKLVPAEVVKAVAAKIQLWARNVEDSSLPTLLDLLRPINYNSLSNACLLSGSSDAPTSTEFASRMTRKYSKAKTVSPTIVREVHSDVSSEADDPTVSDAGSEGVENLVLKVRELGDIIIDHYDGNVPNGCKR